MFDYNKMIKRAIEFFPQWSDIRKRYKTSVGGRFMSSILEESIKIEDAIEEYIDSYFLYNYIGHEDEVMAFIYTTNIGLIEDLNQLVIYYNNEIYTLEQNLKVFEQSTHNMYYEDGKVYLKVQDYVEGVNTLQIFIDELSSDYALTKTHVWNIFDEFATFVNTRRYEDETNKQLLDRILYITNNLPNGTEEGLKHAIISELLTDFPDITKDDIKIEGPTPENLIKAYEDYETLLDLLAEVNRDVYRTKRWDIDYWQYNFESIEYIPHVWDKVVKEWQNGVGSFKDLEVILSDNSTETDATIYFYQKTLEAFQKYVYDKYIENNIHFTLTKYNNILNKTKVLYKIQASELEDISFEDIYIRLYESETKKENILIENIATDWGRSIEKIDNSIIDENDRNNYKLSIKSNNGYDLKITQANVLYADKNTGDINAIVDLLDNDTPGFVLNSEYELVSTATKMIVNNTAHFTTSKGLKNDQGFITLDDDSNEGEATLSLSNKAGLYVNYIYDCDTVPVPDYLITCIGGYWDTNDNFVVRGDYSIEDKVVKLNIVANYLSFKISEENINAKITMEYEDEVFGKETIELGDQLIFSTKKTETPRKISITMNILSIKDVKFSDFKYNNFSILLSTKYGTLNKTDKGYKLGNFYNNELRLKLSSSIGCSPYIEGIYIGDDFSDIKFNTEKIPAMDNHIRIFKIITNGTIDLIKLDDNGFETDDIVYNYRPYTQYKATEDDAYIRVDLSDYTSIEDIPNDEIILEKIEESGTIFYNIRLKNKQIIDSITIKGTKIREARIVTLQDMIKFYIEDFNPTYDRIYCSKCSKGLVLGRQNPGGTPYNLLINIKSEIFTGLDIVKYTMVLPEHLGTIYGSNNGYENRSNSTNYSFDYISIYPNNSQIYQAINEYTTCIENNRFIPITNNFSPALNINKLLFYNVELYNSDDIKDYIEIRFHNDLNSDMSIYDLPTWSIGTSNSYIAIQNNMDMLNSLSYSTTSYNIDDVINLSSSVDIKETYSLTDNTILNTEKFIVSTDNNEIDIKYEYYDGTTKKSHLLKFEEVTVESDGFNKLAYSNIDTIYHISKFPYEDMYMDEITEYNILKDEGIIIWKDNELIKNNTKVYLVYSIKKPIAFVFKLDYLYKAIDFDINAYSFMNEYKMSEHNEKQSLYKSGDKVYLNDYKEYEDADLVYVSCDNPTFEAQLNDNIITFNKYTTEPTLLVKTGYYYINGREYYLFSEDNSEDIKNNALYRANNIDISGGEITTYKPTNNYLSNSEMRLKGVAELYNFDCTKPLTYGISKLNSLTSCDSFNNWNMFGMIMKLTPSLNGLGLQFEPEIENGYAYLDITNYLSSDSTNYISFYATKDLKVYLGKEEKYLNIDFNRALNIALDKEIEFNNSDIRSISVDKIKNYSYYLIVQAAGDLDDIVISTDISSIYESHTKNISILGFDLYEKKVEGTRYKMLISSNLDYKSYHASLMSDGYFKTTSNIDWYITQIYNLDTDEDFKNCSLKNIGVGADYIYTTSRDGYVETPPIFVGDIDNIARLIFKVNDIDFINMKNFDIVVETSNRYNGVYTQCGTISRNNKFHINSSYLNSYIKLKITMPAYKYINNISIFAEYISSNEDPLSIITKQTGYIESKIYDLQELTNCFVKSLDIDDISNINDVSIQIRSSRDTERLDVWDNWKEIKLNKDLNLINTVSFTNTRFLQFKIVLKTRKAFIKLKGINIEIK